jgi:hypothetical protein
MTRTVHVWLAAALTIAVAVPALAQDPRPRPPRLERLLDPRNGPEVTDRFSRTVRMGRDGTLDLSNVAGAVVITGGGGNDVTIDAMKRTRDPNEEAARNRLREVDIQVTEASNRVEVRTVYPREQRIGVVVDYTVTLPQGASVFARNVSGDVKVTNVRGELRAESVSGNVEITGGRRLASVRSVSGNVTVNDSDAGEFLSLHRERRRAPR